MASAMVAATISGSRTTWFQVNRKTCQPVATRPFWRTQCLALAPGEPCTW